MKKLRKHGVEPGRTIAVVGAAEGLGHYAVQLATAFGYRVVGVDIGEDRLAFVRELGAELAVSPDEAVEVVTRELGGVDASLVFSAKLAGFDLGMQLLRKAGLFVAIGLPATSEGKFELDPFQFFMKEPTIVYSAVGTVQDMRARRPRRGGKVKTHVSRTGALSELPTIFDELEAGRTWAGRSSPTSRTEPRWWVSVRSPACGCSTGPRRIAGPYCTKLLADAGRRRRQGRAGRR